MKMIVGPDTEIFRRAQETCFDSDQGLLLRLVDSGPDQVPPHTTTYEMQRWELHPDGTMTITWARVWWEL